MSEVQISQLAADVGIPVERLLHQLQDAGIDKSNAEDMLTETEKLTLLNFLRRSHGKKEADDKGTAKRKVTLKRKVTKELKQPTTGGRAPARGGAARAGKTVNVEVRRKRTFTKQPAVGEEKENLLQEVEAAKKALAEQAEQQRQAEELAHARRDAEGARREAQEIE